ncbi:unnamed protein product [Cuscuta europaea]|uniref:Uncharacterized protein n=1 Tax=Cuscuta europaea TaxID=41803 RepID=A0A9P0VMV0_CUSEU|nr:unnamed protein product [Cuscuta europaea]
MMNTLSIPLPYAFDQEKENDIHSFRHPNTFHRNGGETKRSWNASLRGRLPPVRDGRNHFQGHQNWLSIWNLISTHDGGNFSRKQTQRPAVSSRTIEQEIMEGIISLDTLETLAVGMGPQRHEADRGPSNLQQKTRNHTWADLLKYDRATNGLIGNMELAAPSLPATSPQKNPDSILLIKDNNSRTPCGNREHVETTPSSEIFYFLEKLDLTQFKLILEFLNSQLKNEFFILEFQKSRLHKISFNSKFAPQIIGFISQELLILITDRDANLDLS